MNEDQSLARAIDESVAIFPYDPAWPRTFDIECNRLNSLGETGIIDIRHFGSTAVPGMAAKPIIDVLIGVSCLSQADVLMVRLRRLPGYATSAEFNATLPDRRWLMKYEHGRRSHHLHIVAYGGKQWLWRLRFRDALRIDEHLARQYEAHKRDLARKFRDDREAYTAAKREFVVASIGDL